MTTATDGITCVFISAEQVDSVIEFVQEHFIKAEPLACSINRQWTPRAEKFIRGAIEQGRSVIAIDSAKNNKIVGVRVHELVKREDRIQESLDPSEIDNTNPIRMFLDFCLSQFDPWSAYPEIDSMMDGIFIAVHKEYRGRNLGIRMMEFTFEFMRNEKIPLYFLIATSKYSRAMMKKLDFETVFEIRYEDYKVDGKRVFYPEEIHTGATVMVKRI